MLQCQGTGKTVMTLALVLATIEQLPAPEVSVLGTQPVMTPLAFRHFPSSHYAAARKQFLREKKETPNSQHFRVPSLVELLLHRSRTVPDTTILDTTTTDGMLSYEHKLNIAERLELSHFPQLRTANVPFYHQYQGEPTNNERMRRDQSNPGPRVMYLTSATLILVPPNLISQWDREIQKHCEYPLRVILLRSRDPMPAVKSLASDYDVSEPQSSRLVLRQTKYTSRLFSWPVIVCISVLYIFVSSHKIIQDLQPRTTTKIFLSYIPGKRATVLHFLVLEFPIVSAKHRLSHRSFKSDGKGSSSTKATFLPRNQLY